MVEEFELDAMINTTEGSIGSDIPNLLEKGEYERIWKRVFKQKTEALLISQNSLQH